MKVLSLSILCLISVHGFSQGNKCNSSVLEQVQSHIEKLNSNEIRVFLSTFDISCKNNVEFSELSNELLFEVLEKHTKKVLTVLEKQYPEIQLDPILDVLRNPIIDKVDLNLLIKKIEKTKVDEKLKTQILDALRGI